MAKKEMKYVREEYVLSEEDSKNYNTVHLPTKNGYGIYKEFLFLNQFALLDIVENYNLSKNGTKIFLWLLARVSIGNLIYTYLDEMSNRLHIDKANVSRELKRLEAHNIIIRKSRLEGARKMQIEIAFNFDRLNSNIGYKGKLKTSSVKRLQQDDEPTLSKNCVRTIDEKGVVYHVDTETNNILWQTGDKIPQSKKDKQKMFKQLNIYGTLDDL